MLAPKPIDFLLKSAHHVRMGSVDARARKASQNQNKSASVIGGPGFPAVIGLVLTALFPAVPISQGADFHTNAIFNVTFSLPGQVQNTLAIPDPPIFVLTTNWSISPSNDPGSLITPNGANQRTIAYNTLSNQLYLVSRTSSVESNYVVYGLTTITTISAAVTNISDGVTNISAAVTNVPGTVVSTLSTSGIYNDGAVGEGGIGLRSE